MSMDVWIIMSIFAGLLSLLALLHVRARAGGQASSPVSRDKTPQEFFLLAPEKPPRGALDDETPGVWDRDHEVRQLIDRTKELSTLYGKLGYSPDLHRQAGQRMKDLKDLIRAEIPDFVAFQKALRAVQGPGKPQERGRDAAGPAKVQYQEGNDALLQAVLAAGSDQEKVLALLNRDPVDEPLPFVEQLPFSKEGKLIWRTPAELSLIRKRPTDPARFALLLDEAEQLFRASRIPLNENARQEVVEAIGRVRKDLQRQNAYIPTALQALERKITECMQLSSNAAARVKKEQVDTLLGELVYLRHQYGLDANPPTPLDRSALASCKETIQHQAKVYLESPWMQTPWLTTYILTTLLDSELMALPEAGAQQRSVAASALRLIRNEVASGHYDSDATIRRLGQQEAKGLYIHSLIYPLLRLNRAFFARARSGRP